jgi:glycosyltransferase involved in cell wall biosynthesis
MTTEIQTGTAPRRRPEDELELSIVIPCLNEARTVGTCVRKARASLERLSIAGEVVVADDGSTDGSQAIAEELGARVVPVSERGYGSTLSVGIAAARGRYVIMGDADGTYDFGELGSLVEKLREGHDLVVGNRFRGTIHPGSMPFLHKYLGNPVLSFIGRRLFGTNCGDIYCGLRGFDREQILDLDIRATGMEFAVEMVVKATIKGLRIAEVPTTLSPDADKRKRHLRTWRDGWRTLRLLLLYSPRWLFLYPGLAFLVVGLVGMAWLIPGPRTVGGVSFDIRTLLYTELAIIVGLQAVYFFLTARWFGISEGLVPDEPRLRRIVGMLTPEVGFVAGLLLIACGLGLSVIAVAMWNEQGFGDLAYPEILRIVIPGSTLIVCGMQTVLLSLFLSMLGLRRR